MKEFFLIFTVAFLLSLFTGKLLIPVLKRLKAGQTILGYVKEHKDKNGTPTMGGLFFVVSAVVAFYVVPFAKHRVSAVCVAVGLAYMTVGFLDDVIKIRQGRNLGLKAYQKILFQLSIAVICALYVWKNGITRQGVPFFGKTADLGVFTIPITIFVFIATTNCVNLTDGLDGLAGSVCMVYFLFIALIVFLSGEAGVLGDNGDFIYLCSALSGALLGFLCYNTHKASVFMGDTGSLALGGFVAVISILSGNVFYIPILGITFVMSGLSVILQVIWYKKTKKRIFLMAPIHHHFQLKGYNESKIVALYSAITVVMGCLTVICIKG